MQQSDQCDAAIAAKETKEMTTSLPQTKNAPAKVTTKARAAKRRPDGAPTKAKPARKAAHVQKPAPARNGTKTTKILDLLKRPAGVTLKELMKTTGWQAHSVRGFLSGTLGKKMGTPVESSKRADGERLYRLPSK
jgi:hypothetical protein